MLDQTTSSAAEPKILAEYWLHYLGSRKEWDLGTLAVVHVANCGLRQRAELARFGRTPAERDGVWLGPFSAEVAEKRFSKRQGYRFCHRCCPSLVKPLHRSEHPGRYGPRRLLSPRHPKVLDWSDCRSGSAAAWGQGVAASV